MSEIIALQVSGKNFEDDEFDFVFCAHVHEDILDPLYVCSQMICVGKSGHIATLSCYRECTKENCNDPVSGREHHRWIVNVEDKKILLTTKFAWAHKFDYSERVHKGSSLETESLFYFY